MRWSLQWQLFAPLMAVLALALGLTSLANAYLGISAARHLQHEQLRRAAATLSDASFPLTRPVLLSIRNLTGAEYVVVSAAGKVQAATVDLPDDALARLNSEAGPVPEADFSRQPVVRVAAQDYFAARVLRGRAGNEAVLILVPRNGAWAEAREAAWPPLLAGSVALLVSLGLTAAVARRMVRPIRQLGEQAERIAGGEFRPMPLPKPIDEIHDLSATINRMAARLEEYTEQVRRTERLRALDLLSGGLAHQLRNSVMGARLAIELHQRDCQPSHDESISMALAQLNLMESYLQRFLTLGRLDAGVRSKLEVGAFLAELLELVRPACRHAGVALLAARQPAELWIEADPALLRQMFMNLLLNALEAARPQGDAGRLAVEYTQENGEAIVRIGDSGPGPAAEIQAGMFEPFVSNKPDGTGLGLSVANQIAAQHKGAIEWRRENGMTWFVVRLPR